MRFVRKIVIGVRWCGRVMLAPLRLIGRAGSAGRRSTWLGTGRSRLALLWRRLLRGAIVVLGLLAFIGCEWFVAYTVNQWWWWFTVGFYITAITLAAVMWRPTFAFVAWLVISPLGTILLKLDWGADLPAITFDRLALYSLAALFVLRTLASRSPIRKLTLPEYLLIGFTVYSGANMFFHEPGVRIRDINVLLGIVILSAVLYFVAKAALVKREHVAWLLVGLVVVGIYTALSGIYEHYTGTMWFSGLVGESIRLSWDDVGQGRSAGQFGNTTVYGAFLGLAIFVAFHLSAYTTRFSVRILYYASIVLMVVGCYFCYTRGGYIPLALFLLLMPFLATGARKHYAAVTLVGVLVLMVAIPILLSDNAVYRRMSNENTVIGRVATSATLYNAFRHNFIFGVGLNRVHYAIETYVTNAGQISGMWARGGGYHTPQDKLRPVVASHNSILTLFVENGIIGGLLYYGAILLFVWRIFAVRSRLTSYGLLGKDYPSLIVAFIVGHLISLAVYDVRYFAYPNYIFWILIASVVRLDEMRTEESKTLAGADQPSNAEGGLAYAGAA